MVVSAGGTSARLLFLLALISGGSALVYETIWMRWFRLLFGNTAYAASATLCAFFAGLALGTIIFGRISGRIERPLRMYAWVEGGAALAALWVPLAISLYEPLYSSLFGSLADQHGVFVVVKFALALVAMLPASFLLGGTLPLLVTALTGNKGALDRIGSRLYAVNTFGAALGVVCGAFWLPEWIGVTGTYLFGVMGTMTVAAVALHLSRRSAPVEVAGSSTEAEASATPRTALVVAGASGFGTLAAQVLLIHSLGQLYSHSAYSFGMVLLVLLVSLGISAVLVSVTARLIPPGPFLRGVALLEGFLLLIFPGSLLAARGIDASGLLSLLQTFHLEAYWVALVFVIFAGTPIFVVGGLVFPLTFRLVRTGAAGPQLGALLAANTVGGILGSLAASFVLLELLGLWSSMAALGVLYGLAAILVPGTGKTRLTTGAIFAVLLLLVLIGARNPWALPTVTIKPGEKLIAVTEGAHGIVSVVEDVEGHRRIKVDDRYEFGNTKETVLFERTGHLPLLLHRNPKSVAFIGSATGSVAGAATLHPVEQIHMVELVPAVQEFSALHFAAFNRAVHEDPRTRHIAEDGRNYLRGTPERHDVIIEDLFVPYRPSAAAMYSREHYFDAREHLTENGVFCQWLPIYQLDERLLLIILSTFLDVFPEGTLWRAHVRPTLPMLALVGCRGSLPDQAELEGRTRELKDLGIPDPWVTDPQGIWLLYLGPAAAVFERREKTPIHCDPHPIFEFEGSRYLEEVARTFRFEGWPRIQEELVGTVDPIYPDRNLDLALGAMAWVRSNLAARNQYLERAKEEFGTAQQKLPPRLLRNRDSSFSMVWPQAPR